MRLPIDLQFYRVPRVALCGRNQRPPCGIKLAELASSFGALNANACRVTRPFQDLVGIRIVSTSSCSLSDLIAHESYDHAILGEPSPTLELPNDH